MDSITYTNNDPLISLRRIALTLGALSALSTLIIHLIITHFWGRWVADRWFVFTLGIMLVLIWNFWRNLPRNYRLGEHRILPSLGTGNTLTFLRGLLVAATAGFIAVPLVGDQLAWIPALFYTLASLGDFMDGYLARRQGHSTLLGEILDMYVDGIGVLVATILLLQYGKVPAWYLLVGMARYIFLGGVWLRQRMGKPVYDLQPNDTRRALAAVQMIFIFILLWPIFTPPATTIAATAFAVPFLLNFLRDWLLVSGILTPHSKPLPRIEGFLFGWLPILLRFLIFTLAIASALNRFLDFPTLLQQYSRFGFPVPGVFPIFLTAIELTPSVLILIGFSGRAAALAGLILIGVQANFIHLTTLDMTLIVLYSVIFHLGTGFFSLWQPEDRLIGFRAGHTKTGTAQHSSNLPFNSNSSLSKAI